MSARQNSNLYHIHVRLTLARRVDAQSVSRPAPALLCVSQLVKQADQLILGSEIDLNPAAFSLPDDADAGAKQKTQLFFGGAGVDVDRAAFTGSGGGFRCSAIFLTSVSVSRTERFRVITSRDNRSWSASADSVSRARACPIDSRPTATSAWTSGGQPQQTHVSSPPRRGPCRRRRRSTPGSARTRREPAIRHRFVDGVEILALDVLDERHLQQRALLSRRDVSHDDGDA